MIKKIIFSIFFFIFFILNQEKKAFSLNSQYQNKISNKLLIGINLSAGFSGPSSDDFFFKYVLQDENGNITQLNSINYNYEFDSALNGGISFDYLTSSGLMYGFEISYGQFKGIDPNFRTAYLQLNNKNIMFHGGYVLNFGMFLPYALIGLGFDSVQLEGKIPYKENPELSLFFESGFLDYKRAAFSASVGTLINFSNTLFGIEYKFQGSFNPRDDILELGNGEFPLPTGVVDENTEVVSFEFQKFTNQAHMISISVRIPI